MNLAVLAFLGGTIVFALVVFALAYYHYRSTAPTRDLTEQANERLAEALPPGIRSHLEAPVELRAVAVVNEHAEDGEPIYVPVARVDLDTADAPGLDLAFDYVGDVLEAIHPVFADEHVRHYDVEFSFGPDGLFVSGECRRVAVPPAMAARYCEDDDYRTHDLRRDVEDGDDGDSVTPPVAWGECQSYQASDSDAMAATTAGTGAGF